MLITVASVGAAGDMVSLAFAWGEAELGTFCVWVLSSHPTVRHLCSLGQGFRLQTPLLKLMQMGLRPLGVGPACAALWVGAGPGEYKGQAVVEWEVSIQIPQNAEGLLCPEKARFHRVGSISDHFVRRLLAAFFLNAMS